MGQETYGELTKRRCMCTCTICVSSILEEIYYILCRDAVCFGTLSQRSAVSRQAVQQVLQNIPADGLKILDVNLRAPFYAKDPIAGIGQRVEAER